MSLVKLGRSQNTYTSRGFRALASTNGAFGNTGRASDSLRDAPRPGRPTNRTSAKMREVIKKACRDPS